MPLVLALMELRPAPNVMPQEIRLLPPRRRAISTSHEAVEPLEAVAVAPVLSMLLAWNAKAVAFGTMGLLNWLLLLYFQKFVVPALTGGIGLPFASTL